VLQETITEELKASLTADAVAFAQDLACFDRLCSALPELTGLMTTVLDRLVIAFLAMPFSKPIIPGNVESASKGIITARALATLYGTLASYNLDDQVRNALAFSASLLPLALS
jgi:hypothetical protein